MMNKTFDFLSLLQSNNNREWFFEHMDDYEDLHYAFEKKIDYLISLISTFDPDVEYLTGRDCSWRIFKDFAFVDSDSIFKTCFEAFLARGGKKSPYCGYILHVEPGNCFIGGGLWAPETALLQQLRKDVYEHFSEFQDIINEPVISTTYSHFDRKGMLRNLPSQYPKDFERTDLLMLDTYRVIAPVPDSFFENEFWPEVLAEKYKCLLPLHNFLNIRVEDYVRKRY